MAAITLTGTLTCHSKEERAAVLAHLPAHIRATVREPGCLYFAVAATDDPMVWSVEEAFVDKAAFKAHQERAAASDWGRETATLRRDYEVLEAVPTIRPETMEDEPAVHLLTRAAYGDEAEAELVGRLREDGDLAISLVARLGRAYLGHVALSEMKAPFKALALAPLSVRRAMRRQGLGGTLIRAALVAAKSKGYEGIFVQGDAEFYARFGFAPAQGFDGRWHGADLQLLDLTRKGLPSKGKLEWAPAFDALP